MTAFLRTGRTVRTIKIKTQGGAWITRTSGTRDAVTARKMQRMADERNVLLEALSDEFDAESLLETDGELGWQRASLGADIVRRLRRGQWVIQDQLDLHGARVDEARELLGRFLREAVRRGVRCVRVVHGKGLGSRDRQPVLTN